MKPCGTEKNRHVASVLGMFMICWRTHKKGMNTVEKPVRICNYVLRSAGGRHALNI